MNRPRAHAARPRSALACVALAALLIAVPLPRLGAAAHDPGRAGTGMATRVPLLLETGARLGSPGAAAGLWRVSLVPGREPTLPSPRLRSARHAPPPAGEPKRSLRLVRLGRLQLEGG